jgi:hypothetical protein
MKQRWAEGWMPVFLWRGWARLKRLWRKSREEGRSMRIRILCGAYELSSPFIEGGCATDWIEDVEGSEDFLECPGCGQRCPEEIVGCAKEMLETRVVFVFGCTHRAFTFSRRDQEPYFCASESQGER